LESDLGGEQNLTAGRRQLIQHAALLGAVLEDYECRWLRQQPVEMSEYLQALNVQRRLLVTLGLDRQARQVNSSYDDDLADRMYEQACAELDAEEVQQP
jgi:hypothetical protein